VVQQARHCGGEVAAAEPCRGGVARVGGSSVRKGEWRGASVHRVEASRQEVARGGGPERRAAWLGSVAREAGEKAGGRGKGPVCNF